MAAPSMTTRSSTPGHRRSSSAGNVSASTVPERAAPTPAPANRSTAANAPSTTAAPSATTTGRKTPATKAKAVAKRRNSLSAGALVNKSARVLVGVIAMVDVRVGPDGQINCSDVVADKMIELGAVIVKRFTPRVTHIVLSQLTDVWKDKIAKWQSHISVGLARRVDGRPDVYIVSQLWVNACYVSKSRMAEKPFFPVSKAAAGIDSGHLHLNGAMRQFLRNNPPPPPQAAAVGTATTPHATLSHSSSISNSSVQRTSASTSSAASIINGSSSSATPTATTTPMSAGATANGRNAAATNRRRTLDAKSVSTSSEAAPTATVSTATTSAAAPPTSRHEAPPASRHAAIQFQFGAAAALAAATLGSQQQQHALKLKRKRRALSMEPMATDAIEKLLTTPHKHAAPAATSHALSTPVAAATAATTGTAAKPIDLDAIGTPESVKAPSRRRPMSSAKRRKTMSEVPSATLSMPVVSAASVAVAEPDPGPQKKLFQDALPTDCVAESQSDDDGKDGEGDGEGGKDEDGAGVETEPATPTDDASSVTTTCHDADSTAAAATAVEATSHVGTSDTSGAAASTSVESSAASVAGRVGAVSTVAGAPDTSATLPMASVAPQTFSVGVASSLTTRPVRATRAAGKRPAGSSASVTGSTASTGTPTGIWTCVLCGGRNTRARHLCQNCRAPKSRAAASVPPTVPVPAPATRATTISGRPTRRLLVAPEPPPLPPTPVRRPATTTTLSSPKATTDSAVLTRRILTTPKTITKLSAGAAKRQRAAAAAVGTTKPPASSAAARKLPLTAALLQTPSRPSAAVASSSSTLTPARSLSVLEMTPVRVTERVDAKRSLVAPSSPSSRHRAGADQLERLVTPQRVSTASSRRSTLSAENTPTKTPRRSGVATSTTPSATTTPSALRRRQRLVIGITGVDLETRGVIECAVHAIDASMVAVPSHRKTRIVKSVDYSAAVTHLVVGDDAKRTIKVLFAIARGAWIVSEAWIFASLEREMWLPETDFELSQFANRLSRQHVDARQIFRSLKFFVGANVDPSREVLQSLLQCAGGEICNQISVADMCVCGDGSLFRRAQRTGVRVVTAKWVFDSIGSMRLVDDDKYGANAHATDAQPTTDGGA